MRRCVHDAIDVDVFQFMPSYTEDMENLREFYDPDTVDLMEWIKYVSQIMLTFIQKYIYSNLYLNVKNYAIFYYDSFFLFFPINLMAILQLNKYIHVFTFKYHCPHLNILYSA